MNKLFIILILLLPFSISAQKQKKKSSPKKTVSTTKQPQTRTESVDGDSTLAYKYFKEAYYDTDNAKKIELYTKAIEAAPNFLDAYLNRAATYIEIGDYKKAFNEFEKIKESKIRQYDIFFNCGLAYYRSKRFKDAIADFETALKHKPDSKDAKNALGGAHANYDMACKSHKNVELSRAMDVGVVANYFDCIENVKTNDNTLVGEIPRLKNVTSVALGINVKKIPDFTRNEKLKSITIASDSIDVRRFLAYTRVSHIEQLTITYNAKYFKQSFFENISNTDTLNIIIKNIDDFVLLAKIDAPGFKSKNVKIISDTPVPHLDNAILFKNVLQLDLFINTQDAVDLRKLLPTTEVIEQH
jgi:Tfp pilus assembly protein PilF